jgi:hypothetical protein
MNASDMNVTMQGPVCPVPLSHNEQIVMGHGSGGKMLSPSAQREQ